MLTLASNLSAATRTVTVKVDEGEFTATVKVLTRAEVDAFEAERKVAMADMVKIGFALVGEAFGGDERERLIKVAEEEIEAMQKKAWSELPEVDRAGQFFSTAYPAGARRQDALRTVAGKAAAQAGKATERRAITERFLVAVVLSIDGLADNADAGEAAPVKTMTPEVAGGMLNTVVHVGGAPAILGDLLADVTLNAQYLTAHEKKV